MAVNPVLPMTHPLVCGVAGVLDGVDELRAFDPAYLGAGEKRAALTLVTQAIEQLKAVQSRLLANAEDVAVEAGDRNVAAWAERHLRADYSAVAREARLGEALDRRWPEVAEAYADGRVNQAQAHVIVTALDGLPDRLGPVLKARAEAHLVEQAASFGPRQLKVLGRHLLEVLAPEIADEEERRRLQAEERAARRAPAAPAAWRGDGSTDINARVPDAVANRLKVYLESFAAPRRQEPTAGGESEVGRLPYPRRLGEAFCALLERVPSSVLPQHGGTSTAVMVTIPFDRLLSGLGAADLGTGDRITASEARRLACTAEIIPVVLGGRSEVLDLGRSRRLFSAAQRKAMAIRDRRCRAESCEVPAAWAEAHHLELWARGGRTDLADGILLCSWHHHRAHDDRFDMRRLPTGDVRFTRRT